MLGSDANLEVAIAELDRDDGWSEAVAGCEGVLHVASPFPAVEPKNDEAIVAPARDGTLRVLRASLAAGAKRVVVTSSSTAAAFSRSSNEERVATEADWSDLSNPEMNAYMRSKTIAESAAWDFAREHAGRIEICTVLPSTMLGPVVCDASYSVSVISRMLDGSMPAIPRLGYSFVDVRDVAQLHESALLSPRASGERLLGAGEFLWFSDVAGILRAELGDEAKRVPARTAPDWIIRLMTRFDPSARTVMRGLGKRHEFSSEKAESLLGWQRRPIASTVVECARSVLLRCSRRDFTNAIEIGDKTRSHRVPSEPFSR